MKCPKCDSQTVKYNKSRKKNWKGRTDYTDRQTSKPREDYTAKCKKCGWEGEIK